MIGSVDRSGPLPKPCTNETKRGDLRNLSYIQVLISYLSLIADYEEKM